MKLLRSFEGEMNVHLIAVVIYIQSVSNLFATEMNIEKQCEVVISLLRKVLCHINMFAL